MALQLFQESCERVYVVVIFQEIFSSRVMEIFSWFSETSVVLHERFFYGGGGVVSVRMGPT